VLLSSYLVAVLALTSRRAAVTARGLTVGVAAAAGAAGTWVALQFAFPPLPAGVGGAGFAVGCGVAAAVLARAGRLAAMSVAVLAPLLVFTGVVVLSSYGPGRLIPDLVPAALTPAADLAESRIEIQDPYVAMLFLACLAAMTLTCTAIVTARPAATMAAC
jgi:hypothetical protein